MQARHRVQHPFATGRAKRRREFLKFSAKVKAIAQRVAARPTFVDGLKALRVERTSVAFWLKTEEFSGRLCSSGKAFYRRFWGSLGRDIARIEEENSEGSETEDWLVSNAL